MLPMHARHFLSGRGRPSSSAIQSNNCFITGPSRKSFVASIALACSGGKSVNRGGIYLFFLPDSFRDVLPLSIYHCSQKLQPSSHNSVFPPCRITEIRVLFCFRKRQKPAQGYRRNSYLSANAAMLMKMNLKLLLGSSARTETRSRRLATVTLLTFAQATVGLSALAQLPQIGRASCRE